MRISIPMPAKCARVLYDPLRRRYKILYGGRGSAKSWSVARYLISRAAREKLLILCVREVQNSIKESVHRLLCDQIEALGLQSLFIIKQDSIVSITGAEFIFKGLLRNITEIKSTEGVDICWAEEAERISEYSWTVLIPTIFRRDNSELIITFNPEDEKSSTYTRYVEKDGIPIERADYCRAYVNYWDNPWFPAMLRHEMEWDQVNDPDKYEHVWCGRPKKYGDAVIFRKKVRVEWFDTPEGVRFFYGCDFGYAQDPTALTRCFIKDRKLYIDQEAYGIGIELEDLHRTFDAVPDAHRWKITADSARPDTISFLTRPFTDRNGTTWGGYRMVGAVKGKGSVEDGLEFLLGFEAIIIHPRCKGAISEFQNYRWKTDRITGEILPQPLDKSNNVPDAIRYALEGWMKGSASIFDVLMEK